MRDAATKHDGAVNDYAVARELNLLVMGMIMNIYLVDNAGLSPNEDIQEINRAYILLVNELQKLYEKNPELAAIEPQPIWKRFDVLKASTRDIIKKVGGKPIGRSSLYYMFRNVRYAGWVPIPMMKTKCIQQTFQP
ncbi:MAG: hypothetical protein U0451_01725 [Candidatus Saccharimonadales bacterium]